MGAADLKSNYMICIVLYKFATVAEEAKETQDFVVVVVAAVDFCILMYSR